MFTKKQKQVLDFVKSYSKTKGYAPSLEEIRKKFKLASVSTAHFHISKLIKAGSLEKLENRARSISISKKEPLIKIPLLGIIAAGQPIEAIENKESIAVPKNKLPGSSEVYALRVQGDSMIDENINDGDTILIKKQSTAENGEKVVALLNGNEATLKTFYKEKGQIKLQPANKNYQPIIVKKEHNFSLQGVLFDVIKTSEIIQPPQTFVLPSIKTNPKQTSRSSLRPYFENKDNSFVLYLGHCLAVMSQLPANSIDMVFADPPYNLSNDGFSLHAGKRVSVNI